MFLSGLWEDPSVSLADYPEMLKVWQLMEMIPEVFETFQYTMIYTSDKVITDPHTVLCLGQDFWGTQVSLYLNFRGTITNSGTHTKSLKFLPVKLNSYPEISVNFLFEFELDVDSLGSRRCVDDSEVVSAIALDLNSPANLLFLY